MVPHNRQCHRHNFNNQKLFPSTENWMNEWMNAQIRKYVRNYQIVLTQSLSQYFASYIYTIQTNGAIQAEKYIATEIKKKKTKEKFYLRIVWKLM